MKKINLTVLLLLFAFCVVAQPVQDNLLRIYTSDLSLILKRDEGDVLKHVYFGRKFNGDDVLANLKDIERPDRDSGSPEYPAYGGRNVLTPALKVEHANGSQTVELKVTGYTQKKKDDNVIQTTIRLKDHLYNLYVYLIFNTYQKENIITQRVSVINKASKNVGIESVCSSYMPVGAQSYYLTHFSGSWGYEMRLNENKITPGIQIIESKKGVRTAQTENPAFILSLNQPASAYAGEALMGALAWSGNYRICFELDEENHLSILSGINPFASAYCLKPNAEFVTPEMIWTYSNKGYNQASRNLHDLSRTYALTGGDKLNPVVLNRWEGVHFTFDETKLTQMIDYAADLGIEVFVLYDGWFGNKYPSNSAKAGLGDWQVNKQKLPRGLDFLAKYAVSKGIRFGVWIEPEMVNPDGELANNHPDWVVKSPGREISTISNHWLLDLSNPKVQDFVFQTFSDILSLSKDISYIKWDANRHVESFGSDYLSAEDQSYFWVDYTNGLYSIYQRIREKYPHVDIQLCAYGGGRLDYGALKYHNEFWTSDNTDPFTRLYIQYSTSLIYPPKAMASHVTVSPNKQTNRRRIFFEIPFRCCHDRTTWLGTYAAVTYG